jgi:hypothetical protein
VPKAASKVLDKRNMAEVSRENSALGVADTPIGIRMGEKVSPRSVTNKLKPIQGSSLPPLSSTHRDALSHLPPLQGIIHFALYLMFSLITFFS